jgi:hypothetical protein
MTFLLSACETTIESLAAARPDEAETLAAVTELRDHLAARLPRYAEDR